MKKEFKGLIATILAAFMMVGCNSSVTPEPEPEPEHTHTFAEAWSSDATNHWHAATCGHDVKDGLAPHTFGEWIIDDDATETETGSKHRVCTVCDYTATEIIPVKEHEHTYASDWSYDEHTHWHAATCGHDVKGDEAPHSMSEWAVSTPVSADADGVEERHCTVCEYSQTRPIYHKNIQVNYGFKNEGCYQMTNTDEGIVYNLAADSANGYEGTYLGMNASNKVALADAYTFVIKNNGTDRMEFRIGYRDTSVNPRTFANSANVDDYSIYSLNGSGNTKLREVSSGYIKFNIAGGDTARLVIPMVSQAYDQFVLIAVHQTADVSFTIIQTGATEGTHNFEEGWHSDDDFHWKECLDEGCDFIAQKGGHIWVDDPTKDDIPATAEDTGMHYEVCSVCGHTKETVIPVIGGETDKNVDLRALGYRERAGFVITTGNDYDKVEFTQPTGTYNRLEINVDSLSVTKARYAVAKIKNLEDRSYTLFFRAKDANDVYIASSAVSGTGELVSSENGTSSFTRMGSQGAYFVLGANDTAEFKYSLNNSATIKEIGLIPDPAPSEDKAGSFEIHSWILNDKFAEDAGAASLTDVMKLANVADVNAALTAEEGSSSYGSAVKFTASGAVTEYTRIFSVVFDSTYNLAKSEDLEIEFYFNISEMTHSSSESDLKAGFTMQLLDTDSTNDHRASAEFRGDATGVTVTMLENDWIYMKIPASVISAGACETFDRLNFKIGKTARLAFAQENDAIVFAGMNVKGLAK